MNAKKKYILLFFIFVLAFILVCAVLFKLSKSRTFQFFGGLTDRVSTSEKVVALTFDDAPTQFTDEVLSILEQYDVKATFFIIGGALKEYPEKGKNIVEKGHELGNHSYSHERFYFKSQSHIREEVEKTNTLIRETGYTGQITFRPPNGKKLFGLPWYLHTQNIKTIMWDVEPDTYVPAGGTVEEKTTFIVNHTIDHAKPGSIILLHPFCSACSSDRQAIPQIIEKLKAKGYSFVTISKLLTYEENKAHL